MIAWDSCQFWQNGVVTFEKLFDLVVVHRFIAKMIVAGEENEKPDRKSQSQQKEKAPLIFG